MPTAAEIHDARAAAVAAQRARLFREESDDDRWGGQQGDRFRRDPRRNPDPFLQRLFDYVEAEDVVLDIGGGAGRFTLPLALRCREAVNIDPSPGMMEAFQLAASEAGITNVRFVQSDWLQTEAIEGDVSLVSNVTFFVPHIAPFVAKLHEASRRRVVIGIASNNPSGKDLYRLMYGEDFAKWPAHQEILPVLWEMGLLPEVFVMPRSRLARTTNQQSPESYVATMGPPGWLPPQDIDRFREVALAHFDAVFITTGSGYSWSDSATDQRLLITWETN